MAYTYNQAEEFVKDLYRNIGISKPEHLQKEVISERLGIQFARVPASSMRINESIYIDARLPKPLRWQQFGHELCHVLWHQDNQLCLPQDYITKQELQADNFAYYACVPTDMLLEMELPDTLNKAVYVVATTFGVTHQFALKRLELHKNKMYHLTS